MNLDEVIFIRANFDEYPKYFPAYTDIDTSLVGKKDLKNMVAENDSICAPGLESISLDIIHSRIPHLGILHSGIFHSGILHSGILHSRLFH